MRRGLSAFLLTSAFLGMTSSVIGQSPYPYPYGPAPGYGPMPAQYPPQMPMPYPPQMPMQYPPQMPMQYPPQMQPMYYPPQNPAMMRPMPQQWQNPPMNQPRVYNFGPLTELPQDSMSIPTTAPMSQNATLERAPATTASYGKNVVPPESPNMVLSPEACGPDCGDNCGPACAPPVRPLPAPGRGHFITTFGAWYLVPYPGTNTAYTTTSGGNTTSTEFGREVQYGPRASFGYVFHNCWGVRGNYSYLTGDVNQSASNSSATTTLATPLNTPFQLLSPSPALKAGLAPDQFNFRQKFEIHVADVELLHEAHCMDTTFLFSAGARYLRFEQTYLASRSNPGGSTAATNVALSQDDLSAASLFSGWGPTVSFDVSHPLHPCGISIYGNARGSYLFGNDRFTENVRNQSRTVSPAGVASFTDITNTSVTYDNRAASIVEGEAGLQCGARFGRCYIFGRAGAVYQRWFDVGTPISSGGSISFVGGTATVGITY